MSCFLESLINLLYVVLFDITEINFSLQIVLVLKIFSIFLHKSLENEM